MNRLLPTCLLLTTILLAAPAAAQDSEVDPATPVCEWTVTVVGATHLKNLDWGSRGLSDPFVRVVEYKSGVGDRYVGLQKASSVRWHGAEAKQRYRPRVPGAAPVEGETAVVQNDLDPEWNMEFRTRRFVGEGLKDLVFLIWDNEKNLPPQRLGYAMLTSPGAREHRLPLRQMIGKGRGAPGELIIRIERSDPQVEVPDIVGLSEEEAIDVVHRRGLRYYHRQRFISGEPAAGVVWQYPARGERVAVGSFIHATKEVRRLYLVPELVGMTEAAARRALGPLKPVFKHRDGTEAEIDNWFKVVEQTARAGRFLHPDYPWEVVVLTPAAGVEIPVPDLRGKALHDAKQTLAGRYLRLAGAEREEVPIENAGSVLRQDPAPGTMIPFGSATGVKLVYGYHADGLSYDSAKQITLDEPFECDLNRADKGQWRRVTVTEPGYLVSYKASHWHLTTGCTHYGPEGVKPSRPYRRLNCAMRVTPGEWILRFGIEYHMTPGVLKFVTKFVPEVDPAEPNDDFVTAVDISLPAQLTLGLCPTGDADFYRFDVADAGYLVADVGAYASAEDAKHRLAVGLQIFDAERKRIWRGDLKQVRWLPAGRYFLRFSTGHDGFDTRPYGITLDFRPDTDKTEPNDSIETATVVPVPGSRLVRYTTDDVDHYRLVAEEPGWVIVSHPRKLGSFTYVQPFDRDGRGLERFPLPCAVAVDPECVIRLHTEKDYRSAASFEPVDLNLVFVPRTADPFEPNDDPAAAPLVATNRSHRALLLPARDLECYRFKIVKAGPVEASVPDGYGGTFIMAQLFDTAGKPLEERPDYVPRKWDLAPGEYVVRFHQHSGDWVTSLHPYSFRIDAPNEPAEPPETDRYAPPVATDDAKNGLDLANRAYALYLRNEFSQAAELYEEAGTLLPNCAALWNDFGTCCFKLGSVTDAEAHYSKAVEIDPRYSLALRNLGVVKRQRGDLSGYVEWTGKAAASDASATNLSFHGHALSLAAVAEADPKKRRALLTRSAAAFRKSLDEKTDPRVEKRLRSVEEMLASTDPE